MNDDYKDIQSLKLTVNQVLSIFFGLPVEYYQHLKGLEDFVEIELFEYFGNTVTIKKIKNDKTIVIYEDDDVSDFAAIEKEILDSYVLGIEKVWFKHDIMKSHYANELHERGLECGIVIFVS